MHAAVTGRAIAPAANDAAIRLDFDLQDGGLLGAADGGEGSATAVAVTVGAGDFVYFDDGGEMAVVAALRCWLAPLLAAWPPRWSVGESRCRRQRWDGRGRGLGLAAEELLLAQTQLGAELLDLLSQGGFPLEGALMERLPVAGLSPRLELDGEAWADGTGTIRKGRSRTGWGRWPGRQGQPFGFG